MCATSWKAQVPVWTPAHPSVCDQQQEPGRTVTDPLHLWGGQAVPGEALRALPAQPGGWQPAHPSPWLCCSPKMSSSQHRQADIAYPWESPNALLRLMFCCSPPSQAESKGRVSVKMFSLSAGQRGAQCVARRGTGCLLLHPQGLLSTD